MLAINRIHFREALFKHMKAVAIALYNGQRLPVMSKEDNEFVQKVAFMESITESTAQLILSCLVLRSYGISPDTYSMVVQILTMVMSLLSIVFAFGNVSVHHDSSAYFSIIDRHSLQRHDFLTPTIESNQLDEQSYLLEYGTKLFLYAYSFLPMILYMCCLYIVSVSRESLGTLTIIMVMMLNPVIAIPLGKFIEFLHKLFLKASKGKDFPKTSCIGQFCSRFFVFSFNVYLTIIASIIYRLFEASTDYRLSSEMKLVARFDFKNSIYDRCACPKSDSASHCSEVEMNFQNLLIFLPSEYFLLAFLITPFFLHVIHSLLFDLPKPIPMLQFILGNNQEEHKEVSIKSQNELEMETFESQTTEDHEIETTVHQESKTSSNGITKTDLFCFIFGLLFITGVCFFPYTFNIQFEASTRTGK